MTSENELVLACRQLLRRTGAMPGKGMEVTQLIWLVLGDTETHGDHLTAKESAAARKCLRTLREADWRHWLLHDRPELIPAVLNGEEPMVVAEILVRKKLNMPAQQTFGF